MTMAVVGNKLTVFDGTYTVNQLYTRVYEFGFHTISVYHATSLIQFGDFPVMTNIMKKGRVFII